MKEDVFKNADTITFFIENKSDKNQRAIIFGGCYNLNNEKQHDLVSVEAMDSDISYINRHLLSNKFKILGAKFILDNEAFSDKEIAVIKNSFKGRREWFNLNCKNYIPDPDIRTLKKQIDASSFEVDVDKDVHFEIEMNPRETFTAIFYLID
jgi:hypothetical protein